MLKYVHPGLTIVDVAINQGGCLETSCAKHGCTHLDIRLNKCSITVYIANKGYANAIVGSVYLIMGLISTKVILSMLQLLRHWVTLYQPFNQLSDIT